MRSVIGLRWQRPRLFSTSPMYPLSVDSLNPAVLNVQYAVRGELAIKAEEYRVKLKESGVASGLPFDRVISSNIGNPQQKGLDQPPITFVRQVRTSHHSHHHPLTPSRLLL